MQTYTTSRASGVAVISAIAHADSPYEAVRQFKPLGLLAFNSK